MAFRRAIRRRARGDGERCRDLGRNGRGPPLADNGCRRGRQGVRREAVLRDGHPAVLGAEARRYQIPSLGEQRFVGRHRSRICGAGGDGEFEGAGVVQKELEARAGERIAPREDRLRPLPRHRRPDRCERRERGEIAERRVVFDDAVGTRMNGLKSPLERASQIHVDGVLPIARPFGIDVALDDADQLGLVAGQPVAAHLDLDRFAGSRAEPVGVGQNPHSRISRCCPAPFSIDPQSDRVSPVCCCQRSLNTSHSASLRL